jgi:hypothetical protein
MKKIFNFLIAMLPLLASCELETSDNGDFDGYWHLVGVDTLANAKHKDLSQQRIFWAVQFHLIQLRGADRKDEGGNGREYYEQFKLDQSQLTLSNPHEKDREAGDPVITEERLDEIQAYGINALTEHFDVLRLNKDEMLLKSSTLQLQFRKQ